MNKRIVFSISTACKFCESFSVSWSTKEKTKDYSNSIWERFSTFFFIPCVFTEENLMPIDFNLKRIYLFPIHCFSLLEPLLSMNQHLNFHTQATASCLHQYSICLFTLALPMWIQITENSKSKRVKEIKRKKNKNMSVEYPYLM